MQAWHQYEVSISSRSASTRVPISLIAFMNRANCSAFNNGPCKVDGRHSQLKKAPRSKHADSLTIDIIHNCGMILVAIGSRSTFFDVASCTANVAI